LKKQLGGYKVIPTQNFLDEAKKLQKKYPNIKKDFLDLAESLKKDPITGHDHITANCYKVRMAITDKGKGESGGARVIINVEISEREVYILSTYDKSEKETITDKFLKLILGKKLDK
jgi:mRNA-degrading endonuclease RelE of RelBE toxin-antitoxin system